MRRLVLSLIVHAAAIAAFWFADGFTPAELPAVAASDKLWEAKLLVVPPAPSPPRAPAVPLPPRVAAASTPQRPLVPIDEPSAAPAPEDLLADQPGGDGSVDPAASPCVGAECLGAGSIGVDLGATVPSPEPSRIVRVSDIRPPRKLRHVAPLYPELARAARVQGTVVVECIIDPSGRVTNARAVSGPGLLQRSAIDAVEQWQYTPTLLSGIPVSVLMTVQVEFRLR